MIARLESRLFSQIIALKQTLNATLDAQNTKFNLLLALSQLTTLILGIGPE